MAMHLYTIDNLIKDGSKHPVLSKFLSLEEQKQLQTQNKVDVYFHTCYPEEIRKRAIVCPKGYSGELDFKISIYKIIYDKHFGELKHPQILGTVSGLGLTREVIGDIIVGDNNYIIVCSEIDRYITSNLLMINKNSVTLEKVDNIEASIDNYVDLKIVIPSMRLDVVVSKAANVSREKAKEIICEKYVRVNGNTNTNNDYTVKINDVISITRVGRIIIDEIVGTSKKDKIILKIKKTK